MSLFLLRDFNVVEEAIGSESKFLPAKSAKDKMSKEMPESRMSDELQQVERDGFAACSSSIPA